MKLTERQQQRITRYLHEVRSRLGDLPETERSGALTALQARIVREVQLPGDGLVDDAVLDKALENCGRPSEQAQRILAGRPSQNPSFLLWNDRVWLGVCGGAAERLGTEPFYIRLVAAIAGLIVPLLPFFLVVYIGAFLYVYFSNEGHLLPRIRLWGLTKMIFGTVAAVLGLFLGTEAGVSLLVRVYLHFTGRVLVFGDDWGWLIAENGYLFTWALLILTPIAVLAALPVPEAWAVTLKKVVQAGIVIYAVVICFGIACLFVDTTMQTVNGLTSTEGLDAFRGFL